MADEGRYRVLGSTASPYATKLRAILRYRRIPFDWELMTRAGRAATAHVRPGLVPMLRYPGEAEWHTDTTEQIHALERRHPDTRSVIPEDPAIAFVNDLLEDLADEWAVKPLFFYRWTDPVDQAYVSRWAAEEWGTSKAPAGSAEEIAEFRDRQIGRMPLIGAAPDNRALLEECFHRMLDAFEAHVGLNRYLFGTRPALADFAWYSQLQQMATDPTPMAIVRERAPKTEIWCRRLDDASGVDGEWWTFEEALSGPARELLQLAGDVYLPFLKANARAYGAGEAEVQFTALGNPYRQAPFKYQVKCLDRLRTRLSDLDPADRKRLEPILTDTGCWAPLQIGD